MKTLVKSNRSLLPEFPSLLDNFLTGDMFDWSLGRLTEKSTIPSVNIKETEKTYELELAAPGLDKNKFRVELDNDMLVISAEKENRTEDKDKHGNYTRREFSYESFQRSFQLPERMVEKDRISAKYINGILHVTVPKSSEAKVNPTKMIEIE